MIFDDSGAEEIEVARGGVGELMAVEDILIGGPDIQLTDYSEVRKLCTSLLILIRLA